MYLLRRQRGRLERQRLGPPFRHTEPICPKTLWPRLRLLGRTHESEAGPGYSRRQRLKKVSRLLHPPAEGEAEQAKGAEIQAK